MAEYDQALLDWMIGVADQELAAYLESLSDMERKVMEEVLFRASTNRLMIVHLDNLKCGPIMSTPPGPKASEIQGSRRPLAASGLHDGPTL